MKSVQAVRANPTTIPYNRILRHTGFTLPDISRSLRAGRQVQRRLERLAFDLNVGVPTLWYRAYYPSKNISTLLLRSSVDSAMLALRRTTKPRLNPYQAAPQAMKGVAALDAYVQSSGLEPSLLELIKMRPSQINGCAYCLHMHARDARTKRESEERLYLLDAWRESPLYTDRGRAVLAWTEAVTLVSQTHAPNDVYAELRAQFSEEELVKLTVAVAAINAWNRIAISFRAVHPSPEAHAA